MAGHFEFWADMEKVQHMWKDLKAGDPVRIRTLGDSIFIDSIGRQVLIMLLLFLFFVICLFPSFLLINK